MKIVFATDHAGFELKEKLVPFVEELGYVVEDSGAHTYDPKDDYPDYISKAAHSVSASGDEIKGIILGASGQGEAVVANRFKNVRAIVYNAPNLEVIKLSREHNDANILSIGSRFVNESDAKDAVKLWLETPFSNDERHVRRIKKIEEHK